MTTVAIPLLTYPVGSYHAGPASFPAGVSTVDIVLDRTVGGLSWNSLPASTTLFLGVDLSYDAGSTWQPMFALSVAGGSYSDRWTGAVYTSQELWCALPDTGVARLVRASMTVAGSSVTFSGSLTF